MNKKVGNRSVVDRSLPDDLVLVVLSMMGMKSVVQTCSWNKNWRDIWKSASNLFFDEKGFSKDTFITFVNNVLKEVEKVERFELHMKDHILEAGEVKNLFKWICLLVEKNVKKMVIHIDDEECELVDVKFPEVLFTSQSLEELVLKLNVRYTTNVQLPNAPQLLHLKYLRMCSFTTQNLNELLSNCPVLETLILEDMAVERDKKLAVQSSSLELHVRSSSLKHFKILNDSTYLYGHYTLAPRIVISTPKLSSFVCNDFMMQEYALEDLSSLEIAEVRIIKESQGQAVVCSKNELSTEMKEALYPDRMMLFLTAFGNVRKLKISSPTFLEVLSKAPTLGGQIHFPNLSHLEINTWFSKCCFPAITLLLETSPCMECLTLTVKEELNLKEDDIGDLAFPHVTPLANLKLVKVREAKGSAQEYNFLSLLIANSPSLAEIDVDYLTMGKPVTMRMLMKKFSEKLRLIPRETQESLTVMLSESN